MHFRRLFTLLLALNTLLLSDAAQAELWMPKLFGDHMVLQRDAPAPVWGRAEPGATVTVAVAGGGNHQSHTATAAADGAWRVVLDPLSPGEPITLTIEGDGSIEFSDVAVGEVWVCSGQSNMQWSMWATMNQDLDLLSADKPALRFITVANPGSQAPREDFPGVWERSTPAAARQFSAVGYHFGRRLQEVLGVPVGLIDNAWGGSAAEAWTPRARMTGNPVFASEEKQWAQRDQQADTDKEANDFEGAMQWWRSQVTKAESKGWRPPERPTPRGWLLGNQRPGNLFEARVAPIAGFAVRGVIWYQGESNAGRAANYRELFPLMIQSWRDAWGQPKLPFYWVQLADFKAESPDPQDTGWARLRESQTMTLDRLPDTGQAVIIDIGEGNDIHPVNKQEVANRLARLALAKDYGFDLHHESPRLKAFEVTGSKAIVTLAPLGSGLKAVDSNEIKGFAICGEDRKWRWANAKLLGEGRVEVSHPEVAEPVAVRYAWGDNPVVNLYTKERLPVTPFRTDDW